ncbi:3',5'-cyclic-nucleotide phosphodiesterase regA [Naegleria gruberi]|uniref:Phosphodiesterase n=1 Tax=Naegleria gruberi TaxID=5762 RepID=D2W310_NAEGR|nr:3',5'-cyclic-nucleotide phosphodiesterase regA [Naegleria gruberi]EFC36502.1 3',5'-cyclic-nucleotide phosphodiesterase regA [Naegleria gruberi]|eukprot:XP_002669246.1 3',5'-cyclic-nucleotide phosphodiesterase regA [Naegleria gruberi strain NEG-M]
MINTGKSESPTFRKDAHCPERRHAVVGVDPFNNNLQTKSETFSWLQKENNKTDDKFLLPNNSSSSTANDTHRLSSGDLVNSITVEDEGAKKVLVVDDDRVARQVLTKLLEQLGFQVKAVEGGKQALEVLREEGNNYHLLLVDVLMPDMDGLQLLKIFRQAYSEDMPIIMVSSSEDPDTINQCFQSGAEDFLQKPVQLEILKRRVNMCLEDRLRRRKEKAYQEMLQNERINRKKLTLRVKEQEKELEEIKNQINNTVETPMQVVMKTIADLMEGKYSIENSKGALIAVLRSLGSKDLYKPAFSNLLRKGELDDNTRRWLQTEFMNEGDNNVNGNKSNTPISNESSPTTEKNSQQTKEQSQSSSASNQQVSLYHKQVDDIVTKNTLPGDLGSHTFDTLKYSHDQLIQFIVQMFENLGLIETFKIPPKELVDLLTVVRESYKHNPYHNFTHAVDVTQFAYHLLLVDRISQMFSPMEKFALMFSAIMHDVGHPGVNNNYLINIKDELALIYNDVSVLENHHASQAFYLLLKHNICSNLSKDEFKEFRRLVISTILCTDMSHHFEILTKFQTRLQTGTLSKESKEDRLQLMGVILKCSDVSNALRPFDVSEKWSNVLLEEFFLQGDSERDRGLPISPLMDRRSVDKPKSQLNFIDYIAAPLFNNLITYCSCLNTTLGETLQKNRSLWEERAQAASGMGSNQQKEDISSTHTTTTTKNTITTTTTTKTSTTTTTTNSQEKPVLTGSMPSHFAKAKGFTILIIDDESAQCAKKLEQPLLSLSYTVVSTTLAKTESELVKSKADIILLNYDIIGISDYTYNYNFFQFCTNRLVPTKFCKTSRHYSIDSLC